MADNAVLDADEQALPKKKKELTRESELAHDRGKAGRDLRDKLLTLYADIEEGFVSQGQRSDDQMDYWDAYNCELGGFQAYSGNAQIFVPIIHNAVNARATRFTNQLFPKGGRYVEVVSSDGEEPHSITALLEYYVRRAKLRTEVAFPLCVSGDVEGQYNVYVSWSTLARYVTWKETKPLPTMGVSIEGIDEVEEIRHDVILDEFPTVEVLPDADVLILPVTCNSVPEALARGGSVTIIRRWTKGQIEEMIDNDEIVEEEGEALVKEMSKPEKEHADVPKKHADAAGVKAKGMVCLGYETWKVLEIDDQKRLCRILYGGDKVLLSCRFNPYWSDRCPLISVPVKKVAGVVKGISQVEPCCKVQYAANDAVNEGMDSATYALLPIIMTDPLKNPKTNTMILDLAAVWETSPNDTKFASFPELWKGAFEIVGSCTSIIFQTLSVNTAMIPQGNVGKGGKQNQAQIAQEQQVDILTTADAVTVLEEGVFTEILERFAELDAQYRTTEITVKAFGYMGMKAAMERIPPLQMGKRYSFVWYGVEQARNAAQIQQQIALLNVISKIPPQQLPGRRINMVPAIEHAVSAAFGPRLAPLVFEDLSKALTYDPQLENSILEENHNWPVSPMDDDAKHMEVHKSVETLAAKQHIAQHRMAQIAKAMAQLAQQQGPPPGGGPKGGAQPTMPRQNKQPAGAIPPDQMSRAGATVPPRRA